MGIKQVLSAPRSPWQSACVERVISTIRRECLDHVIVFNEASLYRHVKWFTAYYHESGTHLSLVKDTPEPRPVHSPDLGPRRRCTANWWSSPSVRAARSRNFGHHRSSSRGQTRLDLGLLEHRAAVRSPAEKSEVPEAAQNRPPQSRSRLAACLRATTSFHRRGFCRIADKRGTVAERIDRLRRALDRNCSSRVPRLTDPPNRAAPEDDSQGIRCALSP